MNSWTWKHVVTMLIVAGLLGWFMFNARACDTTNRKTSADKEVRLEEIRHGCRAGRPH